MKNIGGLRWLIVGIGLLAIAFLVRPYNGIRHDSILYFGQALNILHPDDLGLDLFFKFGSQSKYTVFPQLLARLWLHWDASSIAIYGVFFGFILLLIFSYFLVRNFYDQFLSCWALLLLIVIPSGYGGFAVFKYFEPYFSARTIAEPLVIIGIAFLLKSRYFLSVIVLFLAAILHPLQALPGCILYIFYVFSLLKENTHKNITKQITITSIVIILVGAYYFNQPLFNIYDNEWWDAIRIPNQHVFITKWPNKYWIPIFIDIFSLCVAYSFAKPAFKKYIKSLLLATILCFIASLIFVDFLKFVYVASAQLWRIQWLLHFSAIISIPLVITTLWRNSDDLHLRLALYIATWFLGTQQNALNEGYGAIITAALFFIYPFFHGKIEKKYKYILFSMLLFSILSEYIRYCSYILRERPDWFERSFLAIGLPLMLHPAVLLLLIGLTVSVWMRRKKLEQVLIGSVVFVVFIFSAVNWDQRSITDKYMESQKIMQEDNPFGYAIPHGANVFWDDELAFIWFVLKRPSYWTVSQEAGLLFNRGTAIEAVKREKILNPLMFQAKICKIFNSVSKKNSECQPTEDVVREVCRASKGALEYMVFSGKIPGLNPLGSWFIPAEREIDQLTYYLYRCD